MCISCNSGLGLVLICICLQQKLQPNTANALRAAVPDLEDEDIEAMMRAPMRSFDPNQIQVRGMMYAGMTLTKHTNKEKL